MGRATWEMGEGECAGGWAGGRVDEPHTPGPRLMCLSPSPPPPPRPHPLSRTLPSQSSMALASPNLRSLGCVCVCVLVEADAVGRRGSVTALMGFTFLDAHERGHGKKNVVECPFLRHSRASRAPVRVRLTPTPFLHDPPTWADASGESVKRGRHDRIPADRNSQPENLAPRHSANLSYASAGGG